MRCRGRFADPRVVREGIPFDGVAITRFNEAVDLGDGQDSSLEIDDLSLVLFENLVCLEDPGTRPASQASLGVMPGWLPTLERTRPSVAGLAGLAQPGVSLSWSRTPHR